MNKILQLFDADFVKDLFQREILPQYSQYTGIDRVDIKPYKELIWKTTYHVVIRFSVYFLLPSGQTEKVYIVCTAHSGEPRENAFKALQYLFKSSLNQPPIGLPRPLFYSEYFRGTFYQALIGENLFYYIKQRDRESIERIVAEAAILFARLHQLPVSEAENFNAANARIDTVTPGRETTLREMGQRYSHRYDEDLGQLYDYFSAREEKFFSDSSSHQLIHGDAHPENIIQTGDLQIGIIDFTDFCLADFARDLGTFLQQLEYKIIGQMGDRDFLLRLKNIFLDTYFANSHLKRDAAAEERIDLYYNWTMVRTAIFLFLKHEGDPQEAQRLIIQAKANLGL